MSNRNPFSAAPSSFSDGEEFNHQYDGLHVRLERKRKPHRGATAPAAKQARRLFESRAVQEQIKRIKKEREDLLEGNSKKDKNCKAEDRAAPAASSNEAGSGSIRIEVAVNGIDVLSFKITPPTERSSLQPDVKPKVMSNVQPKIKSKIKVESSPRRGRDGRVSQAPSFNISQPRFVDSSRIQDLRVHLDNMRKKREVKIQQGRCSSLQDHDDDDNDDEDGDSHVIGVEVEGGDAEDFSQRSTPETVDAKRKPKRVGPRPGPVSSKQRSLKHEAPVPHREANAPMSSPRTPEDSETSDNDSIQELAVFTKQDKIELVDIASGNESSDTEME